MDMLKKIEESEEYFGPFYQYVADDEITDIDYSNQMVWLTDRRNRRYLCKECSCSKEFLEQFVKRVSNTVSKPFHKQHPILEAETNTLRITIVHESVSICGCTVSIRKSLPILALTEQDMIEQGYCTKEMLVLLKNCVKTKMNLVFCGEPGVGKTECAKFFSQFISDHERVITIEDNPEWHYGQINPGKDCVELRLNSILDYSQAIKTSLRLNPKWMMLSEIRSSEIVKLLEGFSTGVRGMTTLHTDDVRKLPDRMVNMAGQIRSEGRLENDIYNFIDAAVLIRKKDVLAEDGRHMSMRYIDQICFYTRKEKRNEIHMIVEDGQLLTQSLPDEVLHKMRLCNILQPFEEEKEMLVHMNVKLYEQKQKDTIDMFELCETVSEDQQKEKMKEIMSEIGWKMNQALSDRRTYVGQKSLIGGA